MIKQNEKYMLFAIREAGKNLKKIDGGPFGACIVKGNKVLAVTRNTVLKKDATSHAEINAIRIASKKLKTFDLFGCVIYSTTEPCPMCFSAIHWARIGAIIYGTKIGDAERLGFNELNIENKKLKALGKSIVRLYPNFMTGECARLLKEWGRLKVKRLY